jgi:predicted alpha/beta-hydrolase family hydrolase
MGGRVAPLIAAAGGPVQAVACFAYPLHPPGKPEQRRDEHLPRIQVPLLVCSGTRDSFGTPDELRSALAGVPAARLHLLEGADHGFSVLKASGRRRDDVWAEAAAATVRWLDAV